ncbi:MAG TPA: hypothetical protein VFZ09_28530 [Archangium sp.]|nr:hypothetical protein [Archangium sp.]HEX5750211.1 hypothetical protein [Archangium sp.]
MRNEQNETTTSPVSTNEGHAHWQVGRLILAVAVCLLIIGAAIAFERFG